MVVLRKLDDEVPQYDPNDLENYFSFRVHHGGEFDSKKVIYIGGSECFYNYVTLDELSMLDIEDIAIELGYNLPMDRIHMNRVVDLYIQHVLPLNVVIGKELVCDGRDDRVYDGLDEVGIGLLDKGVFDGHAKVGTGMPGDGVFDGHDEVETGMPSDGVFYGHDEAGTGMLSEGVCDGPDEVDNLPDEGGNGTSRVTERAADRLGERAAVEENDELVETDYEQQQEEDITANTYVDPTRDWDSLRNPEIPREECGSGSEFDCEDDDLRSLDDFADEQVEGGQSRNFINKRYHEFDPVHDMANPIFKIGMEFATTDVFRKAIRAHAIKHGRNIKF
ncbi:hypothetical protein LWI29_028223 [Acer saccharum]|uniref:PB1-like domain-containing protein n=1 Tax=Acer saccharum TaxID=4024 RepID=A0AA39RJJ0_ACESA|nr:hypothetical protein LWI29_028223 [Acer saccharum]